MTRYELLMYSIAQADKSMVRMFIIAAALTLGYFEITWIKRERIRRILLAAYPVFVLALFVFTTVYSAWM